MDKVKLIHEISEAFKDVELQDGIGLHEANAIDNYAQEKYRTECRQMDEKFNWKIINSEDLNKCNASLSYFDAKGMRFHLPAFMIAEIKREYSFTISYTLTNHLDDTTRFELLSIRQRYVIKLFLEYILNDSDYEFEKPEIKTAIEKYWTK